MNFGTVTDTPCPPQLVVLGASGRALAESATRAGWSVHAADLFRDLDLEETAQEAVQALRAPTAGRAGYPWSLSAAAADFPPAAPWCYTGALENHPDLIEAISLTRPLAGNPADVVRRLRDPAAVAAVVRDAGLAFPETLATADGVPTDGSWLVKPLAGAGGRGIRRWTPAQPAGEPWHSDAAQPAQVWQRFVSGTPLSAAFCMQSGTARLCGASRQLIGTEWCHAGRFAWCGGVATDLAAMPSACRRQLDRLGAALAEWCRPVGMLGVDLVVDESGRVAVIEVNPRPTASMELFERAGAISVAGEHLAACGLATVAARPRPRPDAMGGVWAKAVLFAPQATPVDAPLLDAIRGTARGWSEADGGWAAVADIPRPEQVIDTGAPVLTLFARGLTAAAALAALRSRADVVDAFLAAARRGLQPAIRRGRACPPAAASDT